MRHLASKLAIVIMIALVGCAKNPGGAPGMAESAEEHSTQPARSAHTCREPYRAGSFYPGLKDELSAAVRDYIDAANPPDIDGDIIGLMAPHAGYVFSGPTAGCAFAALEGRSYDTVILIGPSHRGMPLTGAALSSRDEWRTPLGTVPVNQEFNRKLKDRCDRLRYDDEAHADEHSLEVELPFLQQVLGDFSIVPIVLSDFSPRNTHPIAAAIAALAGDAKILIVASTDMSHYPPAEQAEEVDRAMLDAVLTVQPEKVREADSELLGGDYEDLHCTLCGLGPVIICMEAAKSLGASEAVELDYTNSAEADARTAGRCVGYGAVAFVGHRKTPDISDETVTEPEYRLDESQQEYLLTLARRTLQQVVSDEPVAESVTDDPMMHEERAVFVTLKKGGQLRGCIGQIQAGAPLAVAVQDAARSAATSDPRFPPVTRDELDDIDIEISVLSPMQPVDDYRNIEVGKHGVLVQRGRRSGVFLPQVAPEQGWNREEMLQNLCGHKAGLDPEAYKDPHTRLYAFTAQVFHEEK